MGYLIGAIVLGMLVWAGIEIVQTIRNWEPNPSENNRKVQAEMVKETYRGQFGGDAVEGGSQAVGHAIHASHCAAESATCEAAPSAIGHALEGLSHFVHH
jgi:hypothetical protein